MEKRSPLLEGSLSFDGCGINLPDEYRSRLATFTRCYVDKEARVYGPLFAAAPELLRASQALLNALQPRLMRTGCNGTEESAIKALKQSIAQAGGK